MAGDETIWLHNADQAASPVLDVGIRLHDQRNQATPLKSGKFSPKKPVRAFIDVTDPDARRFISQVLKQKGGRFHFQYNPESVKDSKGVEYDEANPLGYSHPQLQFTHGQARVVSFTLVLDVFKRTMSNELPPAVEEQVKFLRSLEYPRKGSGSIHRSPPRVCLTIGRLVVYGVVRKAEPSYQTWDQSLNLIRATMDMEIQETPLKATMTNRDILSSGMFLSAPISFANTGTQAPKPTPPANRPKVNANKGKKTTRSTGNKQRKPSGRRRTSGNNRRGSSPPRRRR